MHHGGEKGRGFGGREAQVGSTQFDQMAACAQARQWQRRVSARGQQQVQLRGRVLQQKRDQRMHGRIVDDVVVVQHEHDIGAGRGNVVDDCRQNKLRRRRLGAVRKAGQRCRQSRIGGLQRRQHIGEKARAVVVTGIEREPRRLRAGSRNAGQRQRRFAVARRRCDQHQRPLQPGVQAGEKTGPRQEVRANRRRVQLGLDQQGHIYPPRLAPIKKPIL